MSIGRELYTNVRDTPRCLLGVFVMYELTLVFALDDQEPAYGCTVCEEVLREGSWSPHGMRPRLGGGYVACSAGDEAPAGQVR